MPKIYSLYIVTRKLYASEVELTPTGYARVVEIAWAEGLNIFKGSDLVKLQIWAEQNNLPKPVKIEYDREDNGSSTQGGCYADIYFPTRQKSADLREVAGYFNRTVKKTGKMDPRNMPG